jgi:YrbI family 3-deoxy-D-manno-octulosonate 8-phosphate phosphatase|tara:strand:+ start:410 stop:910 length:501 start_codon:yes stop_codon:yes gene_type:complete
MKLSLDQIDALVFDFDGVLTDNTVFLDEDGREWVRCNRGDGLAFNELQKLGVKSYIISAEKNKIVSARASKLNIPALYGVSNKVDALQELCIREGLNVSRVFYIGNDLNDLEAMKLSGFSACPADSHPKIKETATFKLNNNGGSGVVRELLEEILNVDVVKILYTN